MQKDNKNNRNKSTNVPSRTIRGPVPSTNPNMNKSGNGIRKQ